MIRNYIICATARSGSNLLCEVLSSLGFAGKPEEHLWDLPRTELEPLAVRWPRVLEAGTGDNNVFAIKLLWYQAERLERELPTVLGMPDQSLVSTLSATLGDPRYVYLTRRDHVRQAISFARAIQTRQWRSMDSADRTPRYDADAIRDAIHSLLQEETAWEDFFTRNAISPYRLSYEEFDSAPRAAITDLLAFLGREDGAPVSLPPPRHRRQADEVTEEWLARYQCDRSAE